VFFSLVPVVITEREKAPRVSDRSNLRVEDARCALVVLAAYGRHPGRIAVVSEHDDRGSIGTERLDACSYVARKRDKDGLDQFGGIGSRRVREFGGARIADQKSRFDDGPRDPADQRRVEVEVRLGLARRDCQRAKRRNGEQLNGFTRACATDHEPR